MADCVGEGLTAFFHRLRKFSQERKKCLTNRAKKSILFNVRTRRGKRRKERKAKMWMVEWKEWNEETKTYEWSSDCWNTWEEVEMIVRDCVTDPFCADYRVTYCG